MARGKTKTIEERLEVNQANIDKVKGKLNELMEERQNLFDQKKEEDMNKLLSVLQFSGITAEEAAEIIKKNLMQDVEEQKVALSR